MKQRAAGTVEKKVSILPVEFRAAGTVEVPGGLKNGVKMVMDGWGCPDGWTCLHQSEKTPKDVKTKNQKLTYPQVVCLKGRVVTWNLINKTYIHIMNMLIRSEAFGGIFSCVMRKSLCTSIWTHFTRQFWFRCANVLFLHYGNFSLIRKKIPQGGMTILHHRESQRRSFDSPSSSKEDDEFFFQHAQLFHNFKIYICVCHMW